MNIFRFLHHGLSGRGPHLQTAAFVPDSHPMRLWADTFPWEAMVQAVTRSCAHRVPPKHPLRGRPLVSPRVLLAVERLKHALGASDAALCQRLRTDVAVMYACGLPEVHADHTQAHVVWPETLAPFRQRLDEAWMDEWVAIQAAAAMEAGLVSPVHLLMETFPAEQGRQRITDATTL